MRRTLLFTLVCLLGIVSVKAQGGTTGDVSWAYEETTKTLTISGTGAMANYVSTDEVPWKDSPIEIVNIKSGVTIIGDYAFTGFTSLKSVTIGSSVLVIGVDAFSNCTNIEKITVLALSCPQQKKSDPDVFENVDRGIPIYVLAGKVDLYNNDDNGWCNFTNILPLLEFDDLEKLKAFRDDVNSGTSYADVTVELTADINLTEEGDLDWEPIGTYEKPFIGTFNGNGKVISNLTISATNTSANRGLFGYVAYESLDGSKAKIKDLILENVTIESNGSASGSVRTGAVAALVSGDFIVENCHVISGTINGTEGSSASNTGGFIGMLNFGEVTLCSNNAAVSFNTSGTAKHVIGGLVGDSSGGTIDRCFNQGTVTISGESTKELSLGGLAGTTNMGTITNSYNTGNVVGAETTRYTGGIVGYSNSSTIKKSFSYAEITGGTSYNSYTGGLVGLALALSSSSISDCLAISESLEGFENQTYSLIGRIQDYDISNNYTWLKDKDASYYSEDETGDLWSGSMSDQPLAGNVSNDNNWSTDIWGIDPTSNLMPKLKGMLAIVQQPDIKNPLKTSETPSIYHTITLEVASGIELYGMTAGNHQITEGGHLHLQFLPEEQGLSAADVLFLVDGVETEFKEFTEGHYFSYILNPVTGDHSILIAMKEYAVTLTEAEGVTYNIGAGIHKVAYGEKFTFNLTLADGIDPQKVHVFANGIEIQPDESRATILTYTIDSVITPVTVVIEGTGGTTGNIQAVSGVNMTIDNGQLTIDNLNSQAVDVVVYTVAGKNVARLRALHGSETINLEPGIYLVKAADRVYKVSVK